MVRPSILSGLIRDVTRAFASTSPRSSVLSLYNSFRRRQSSVRNQGLDGRPAIRIDHQFERGRTFRTKAAAAHGAVGVALDIDHPAVFDVDALPARNRALGADAAIH